MPVTGWLLDGRGQDHEGLSFTGEVRHSHGRACVAWGATARARVARQLLSPVAGSGQGARSQNARLPLDQHRRIPLPHRAGSSHCSPRGRPFPRGRRQRTEFTFCCFSEQDLDVYEATLPGHRCTPKNHPSSNSLGLLLVSRAHGFPLRIIKTPLRTYCLPIQ